MKKEADEAIAAMRNAREMLGEGPRFKDVDACAINAGELSPLHLVFTFILKTDLPTSRTPGAQGSVEFKGPSLVCRLDKGGIASVSC